MEPSDLAPHFAASSALCDERFSKITDTVSDDLFDFGKFILGMKRRSMKEIAAQAKIIFSKERQREIMNILRVVVKAGASTQQGSVLGITKQIGELAHISMRRVLTDRAPIPERVYINLSDKISNKDIASMLYYWATLSSAVYESKSFILRFLQDAKENENFYMLNEKSSELDSFAHPRTFVYADRKSRSIVICVAGTENLSDVLTDLIEEPSTTPWLPGVSFHRGFLLAATNILRQTETIIQRLAALNPEYSIKYIGHSYGAAVASICAILAYFRLEKEGNRAERRAIVFACPTFIDRKGLSMVCSVPGGLIVNFVLGWDIIPRMSVHNVARLVCKKSSDIPQMYTAPNTYWMVYDLAGKIEGLQLVSPKSEWMTTLYYGEVLFKGRVAYSTLRDHSIDRIKLSLFAYIKVLQDKEGDLIDYIRNSVSGLPVNELSGMANRIDASYASVTIETLFRLRRGGELTAQTYGQMLFEFKKLKFIFGVLKVIMVIGKDEKIFLVLRSKEKLLRESLQDKKRTFQANSNPKELTQIKKNVLIQYNQFVESFMTSVHAVETELFGQLDGIKYSLDHDIKGALTSLEELSSGLVVDPDEAVSDEGLGVMIQSIRARTENFNQTFPKVKAGYMELSQQFVALKLQFHNQKIGYDFSNEDEEMEKTKTRLDDMYHAYKEREVAAKRALSHISENNRRVMEGLREVDRVLNSVSKRLSTLTRESVVLTKSRQPFTVIERFVSDVKEQEQRLKQVREYIATVNVGYSEQTSMLGVRIVGALARIEKFDDQIGHLFLAKKRMR